MMFFNNDLRVHVSCAGLHEHAQSVHVRCRGECARVGTHLCRHLFLGQKVFAYRGIAIRGRFLRTGKVT